VRVVSARLWLLSACLWFLLEPSKGDRQQEAAASAAALAVGTSVTMDDYTDTGLHMDGGCLRVLR
jgi:hypothetical protein